MAVSVSPYQQATHASQQAAAPYFTGTHWIRALGALLMFIAASLFGIALVLLAKMFV
jgi:hypothetical protein